MAEFDNKIALKLLELMEKTGYNIEQHNGQRRFGPPPDWTGPPPPRGCEVFIGKLPRDVFEDELVPLFSTAGKIYELRLMMDFSGSNRGYAFVNYSTKAEASNAIQKLNGYEIKPGRQIGVVKSVDNSRLYIGNIPKTKTKEELLEELSKHISGVVDVILYKNNHNKNLNRGFAFVELVSHRAAAMARRSLVPGLVKLWDQEIVVDWAEPEPSIDDEQMKTVKVLYARNFQIWTAPEVIKSVFENAITNDIERVKKIYDYAFIHFRKRAHAELALAKLQNADIDGSNIEIRWAKPVDRDLYRIQKLIKGNAKFNNNFNFTQTLLLYKQHLYQKEYENSSPRDEGIGSAYAGNSNCNSPMDIGATYSYANQQSNFVLAPSKLESLCKRYFWTEPVYTYQKFVDPTGLELWSCTVDLPQVGPPVFSVSRRVGPFVGRSCFTMQQASSEAAELALQSIMNLQVESSLQSVQPVPVYSHMPQVQNCVRLHYDYNALYPQAPPVMPLQMPTMWRTF